MGGSYVTASHNPKDGSSLVALRGHMANAQILEFISRCLPNLKSVVIAPPLPDCVTDQGAGFLQSLQKLEKIHVRGTGITSEGLRHFSQMRRLRSLWLPVRIDDRGLQYLSGLSQLEDLSLYATQITDAGMVSLGSLTNLKWLDLSHTAVGNPGVATLARTMNKLTFLDLRGCPSVNAGVAAGLGGVVAPTDFSMNGTPRLKELYLPDKTSFAPGIQADNYVRMLGMSDVLAAIPENVPPAVAGWRGDIMALRSQGAYVEYSLPLATPATSTIGLYFTRDNNSAATDAGMATLPKSIQRLSLRGTRIANAGLGMLGAGGYSALNTLDLRDIPLINPAGVAAMLPGLPALKTVIVNRGFTLPPGSVPAGVTVLPL